MVVVVVVAVVVVVVCWVPIDDAVVLVVGVADFVG